MALARRISDANLRGQKFQVSIFTGASTGPELDGALAMAGGIHLRLPYQSDPETRKRINAGEMEYMDIHLSHVAQFVEYGFLGKLDLALIEVTAVLEDGRLVPSSSLGNNKTWIEQAEHVIIEVNSWQPAALEGMHDIYYGLQPPPNRGPIPLTHTGQRIGSPYLEVPPEKVVAVVLTDSPDRNSAFKAPDEASRRIAGHILEFLSLGSEEGPHARDAAAAAVGRRQHRQRGALRPGGRPVRRADLLHRGHPGRHDSPAEVGQADGGVGDRVLAQPGDADRGQRRHGQLSQAASCCARRRSPTIRRSSGGWASSP